MPSNVMLRALVLALTALGLASCAATITSDVARFHQLSQPRGETIAIVPMDPARRGSLEFATYAQQVGAELSRLGYRVVAPGQPAELEARMDYGVSPGRTEIATRPGTGFYGRAGWYGGRWSRWGWYDPWGPWGPWGWDQPEVYSYTEFTRTLELTIVRANGGQALFEGKVESEGRDSRLPEVMPYLVRALFTDFPGQSGVTRRVQEQIPPAPRS